MTDTLRDIPPKEPPPPPEPKDPFGSGNGHKGGFQRSPAYPRKEK